MRGRFRRAFRLDRAADARTAVDEELDFHLRAVEDELVGAGWSREEARRETRRRFGDVEATRAYCAELQTRRVREGRRAMVVDELRNELGYALRTLRRAPGYTALVVATLAFGIAANTTVFSVMRPYLMRALPYRAPTELVQVNQVDPVTGWDMARFSWPQVLDWRERSRAFQDLGAYNYSVGNLTGTEGPEQVQYARVTANLFGGVLGAEPLLGRGFRPEEGRPGGEPVVLLGEALWRRRYAADPGILGRPVSFDGVQRTVVGVMPARFVFPFGSARLWIPLQEDAAANRASMNLQIVGRLRPEWTPERARGELAGIQAELAALWPEADGRMSGVTVKPLRQALNFVWDILSISSRILLGAVAFVLLIACVNVASLTLARASGRTREVSLRAALGAPRARLVRELLSESLVLALAAGGLGVLLSVWIVGLLAPVVPEDIYRVGNIEVDGAVLAFSLLVTLATPIAFGLWPALSASRSGLAGGLKEAGRGSGGPHTSRARRALVVAQVALAVVLTTGAGLMLRSLRAVQEIPLGYDAERVVVAEVTLPGNAYPTPEQRLAFVDRSVETLSAVPGIASASAAVWLPLNHETMSLQVAPPDRADAPAAEWPLAVTNVVHPGYFETMGIPLLEGRAFTNEDGPDAAPAAIVSRSLADQLWPATSAVGRTLLAGDDPTSPQTYRVIGVVGDVHHHQISGTAPEPHVYRPTLQHPARRYFLVARAEGGAVERVAPFREALLSLDPELPAAVRPMTEVVGENLLQWSIGSTFLGAFGTGALLLATLGIYGLISYSVAQRRREIGVRIALGATRGGVRRTVIADGVRLTMIGLAIGLGLSLALARIAAAALYGVGPFDPVTLAGVALLFLAVSAVSSGLPAERASRTDPIGALRTE